MRYLLLIYTEEQLDGAPMDDAAAAEMEAYNAFTAEVRDRGLMEAGEALHPTTSATTVRVRDGEVLTTDGPFAETKEGLGGYYVIDVPDLDAALEFASKVPAARRGGAVEVRPVVEH
jgi:hypothetical protein